MTRHSITTPRKGMRDWIVQRLTAVYLALFTVFIGICLVRLPADYLVWRHLFSCGWMMSACIAAALALVWHAWIGMWTIITDYIHNNFLRISSKLIVLAVLFMTFVYAVALFVRLY